MVISFNLKYFQSIHLMTIFTNHTVLKVPEPSTTCYNICANNNLNVKSVQQIHHTT